MLSSKDQLKIDITAKAAANLIPKKMAAKILQVSMATMFRYVRAYKEKGALFVIHGLKGKPSPRATSKEVKEKIFTLITQKYYDYTIRHAWEKLAEDDLQVIAYKTLLGWCRERNFVKRIRRKKRKTYRARPRMPQRGLMLQMDGSYHQWFGKEKSCLIAAIDDADSDVPYGEFFKWETTLSCMKVIKNIIKIKGAFKILYVDKAGAYGGIKRSHFSQLEDACSRLNIQVVYAHSAQAKGRIERLWRTMQDRLIPEMRLNNVDSINKANEYFLNEFLPNHYRGKFTVPVRDNNDEYWPVQNEVIDEIFSVRSTRKIQSDQTFHWGGKKHLIMSYGNYSNGHIEIRQYPEGHTKFFFRDREIEASEFLELKNAA